jgi:YVTN family beta-propeller protein
MKSSDSRRSRLLAFLLALGLAAGCDTAEPTGSLATAHIYVGNQGNFADNNGTVTSYDPETGALVPDAVPGLGGLVQDLHLADGRLYVLLNFSDSFATGRGRIDVVSPSTGEVQGEIVVSTPRGLALAAGRRGYVTNFYANTVTPVDFDAGTVGAPIPVGLNPEGIVAVGDRLYVANAGLGFSTTVSVIDAATNAVVETLDVGCDGPRALLVDDEAEVWVFCTGKTVFDPETFEVIERTNGAVVVLDGATGGEVARFALDAQLGTASFGDDAAYSVRRQEAYAVEAGGALLRFDTAANTHTGRIAPALDGGTLIGGVAYDDGTDGLLVTTVPPDFVSSGSVLRLDRTGNEVGRFQAGVIPSTLAVSRAAEGGE